MMKPLISCITLIGVILGFSYGSVLGVPAIPENGIMVDQEVGQCESGVILRYRYDFPDGGVVVIFKKPNQEPGIYLRFNPGNDGDADEVWVDNTKLTIKELYEKYPTPCAYFDTVKT